VKRERFIPAMLAAVMAAAFLVNAPSLGYGFVFDERLLIVDNPVVHDLANAGRMFGEKFWPGPARGIYYRPLVTLSYAAGYAVAGETPWVEHLINALAHALASGLMLLLLVRLTGKERVAALAAMIFAVHPAHVESVVWVPGRTDVFAAMFMMASWVMLLRARDRGDHAGRAAPYSLAALFYLAALFSKEIAVTLPALIVAHDFFQRRSAMRKRVYEYAALALITAAFMAWRTHVLSAPGPAPAPNALAGLSPARSAQAIIMVFAYALKLLALPWFWRIDFAYAAKITSAPAWAGVLSAAVAALLIGAAAGSWRRGPSASFFIAGFFISVLPFSQLVPFPTLFAQRFLYLPSLFICGLAASMLILAAERLKKSGSGAGSGAGRVAFAILLAAVLLALGPLYIAKGRVFRNDLTFWRAAVQQVPELALAHNNLGIAYRDRGLMAAAQAEYEKTIELDPSYHVARMNLAEIVIKNGDLARGIALLEQAAAEDPQNPAVRNNLGLAYMSAGRAGDARVQWEAALALDPSNFIAHVQLAHYYLESRPDLAAARKHLAAAREIMPGHPLVLELEREIRERGP